MSNRNLMLDIFQEIAVERGAQDAKWGEQNHPLVLTRHEGDADEERSGHTHLAERMKFINNFRAEGECLAWDVILLEEVYEAFAEADETKARAELVQVAAVAVAIIESLDRRSPRLRAA